MHRLVKLTIRLLQVVVVTHIGDPRLTTKFMCRNTSTKEAILECFCRWRAYKHMMHPAFFFGVGRQDTRQSQVAF